MSDAIKHECGIALIRLKKNIQYYINKYDTAFYGLNKLYVMMEKQTNRGQDGAGVAVIKTDMKPGLRYISRYRSMETNPTNDIFFKINKKIKKTLKGYKDKNKDGQWLKENVAFVGEVLLGHLRYGTHGVNSVENCHPFLRQSNWRSKNLVLAGNFNMTNADELFDKLLELGQHPKELADTVTVLEKIGHFIDEENQILFDRFKDRYTNAEISGLIEETLDLQRVLKRSCKDFDGGYAMAGMLGYGAAFVARDPIGIRPAYYYENDEIVAVASERPAIKVAFGVNFDEIKEIKPGYALIISKDGETEQKEFITPLEKKSCSFERIYFSRGTDPLIYQERKMLGKILVNQVIEAIKGDMKNTVFSFIPNTAETAFLGLIDGLQDHIAAQINKITSIKNYNQKELEPWLNTRIRIEKTVSKDVKLRTFITDDSQRDEMVSQVYDTTEDIIHKNIDTVVVMDDSIVRGTTLEKSILRILDQLGPKHIVVVSSAPQIRYPDCYGIDMSKIKEFVAFRAMLSLLKDRNQEDLLDEVYIKCKESLADPLEEVKENHVKSLYDLFTEDEISTKIAQIVTPKKLNAKVTVVFQNAKNLSKACPNHLGDWYFTGNYPTTGGNKIVNRAFVNFMEGKTVRAY